MERFVKDLAAELTADAKVNGAHQPHPPGDGPSLDGAAGVWSGGATPSGGIGQKSGSAFTAPLT
ncbi:MAG: hypothetical protein AAB289_05215, partial [Chloroflexota bacterium]